MHDIVTHDFDTSLFDHQEYIVVKVHDRLWNRSRTGCVWASSIDSRQTRTLGGSVVTSGTSKQRLLHLKNRTSWTGFMLRWRTWTWGDICWTSRPSFRRMYLIGKGWLYKDSTWWSIRSGRSLAIALTVTRFGLAHIKWATWRKNRTGYLRTLCLRWTRT